LWNSNRKIRQSRQPRGGGSLKAEVDDIDEPSQSRDGVAVTDDLAAKSALENDDCDNCRA
jgi:hypothetical protein